MKQNCSLICVYKFVLKVSVIAIKTLKEYLSCLYYYKISRIVWSPGIPTVVSSANKFLFHSFPFFAFAFFFNMTKILQIVY